MCKALAVLHAVTDELKTSHRVKARFIPCVHDRFSHEVNLGGGVSITEVEVRGTCCKCDHDAGRVEARRSDSVGRVCDGHEPDSPVEIGYDVVTARIGPTRDVGRCILSRVVAANTFRGVNDDATLPSVVA